MARVRNKRTKVFISYSHQDVKWLERLKVHLRPLTRVQEVEVWDDTMIAAGSTWQEDIRRAIETAKVAIILVSADFLASDFIATNELPSLLLAAGVDGATIIPVIISPSGFQQNPVLSQFQSVNDPERPLVNLKKGEQEAVWVKVVEAIKHALNITHGGNGSRTSIQQTNTGSLRRNHQTNTSAVEVATTINQQDETDKRIKVKQPQASKAKSLGIRLGAIALLLVGLLVISHPKNKIRGELPLGVDEATIYLDLTSSWINLSEAQRKMQRVSKATLYGSFVLRKYEKDAQFSHRLGTTSVVPNPLDWRSDHRMEARGDKRKCASEVTTTYMLYFDIKDEPVNVPFGLKYEIDFWNAHNGAQGDWHQFYVSSPTKVLTFKISFPKDKPYTKLYFLSGEGLDCSSPPLPVENPDFQAGIDEKTGAKTVTWKIQAPQTHWVYRVRWDW